MNPTTPEATVLDALRQIQRTQTQLLTAVESLSERVGAEESDPDGSSNTKKGSEVHGGGEATCSDAVTAPTLPVLSPRSAFTSRIVLTKNPPPVTGPDMLRTKHSFVPSGGSYSIYYALAVASKELDRDHRPDFTNTEPATRIGPFLQWGDPHKIVAMDPWGHLTPWTFKNIMDEEHVDLRPTIAITKAHMKLPELEESVKSGRLVPDGKVCLNKLGELAVTKFAVEPVWYLPGVAERFGIDEATLRRSLFEHTGGSYPELITRGDIKVFLPPIGGLTVYCFGDPEKMSDKNVRLSLRIHDEVGRIQLIKISCVTDIGTLTGLQVVYNARKRGEDRASDYFLRTENIAGVKDMRFQALMPDILHWLGIQKIDRMLSMSNMKHDAIVGQGIPILERVELPEELIPADSRVEIDAKITAGYFTAGKRLTAEELQSVQGRMWEDIDH
ncbi:GTP cyclohydrolase [Metarhizium album ARSEF 1941]|uniref:GTP cyclohydrolase n=1 Tax=Metarhizium album (strain ARSEF 1941) TaxID=1081103 RepID=A0A0B2X3H1_METAS|nr:GTP cyclohydrolase [Metarhizium album ARSEF 1941]KHO00894.1 GTP cyclohydrolase [Metarhizium album ARSEF 1941]